MPRSRPLLTAAVAVSSVLRLLALPWSASAATAADVEASQKHQAAAFAAHRAGDLAEFRRAITAAADLRPDHPLLQVQKAAGLAATGGGEEAVAILQRVAAMGMSYSIAKEPMFAELLGTPQFDAVLAALERNGLPAGAGSRSFALPSAGLIPEGLACAPDGGFFLGSVREREILRVEVVGEGSASSRRFAALPYGAFGLVVDPARGALWAVSSAAPPMAGHSAAVAGRAALVELDLESGAIRQALSSPDGGDHLFGDLTQASDGTLYWSDSSSPALYRWQPSLAEGQTAPPLEPWMELAGVLSPQGLALLADADGAETVLALADYSLGIHAIDLTTREVRLLATPENTTLLGIDGLYRVGERTLYAVQNGTTPPRILRLDLDDALSRVTRVVPVLSAHPDLDDPTLGAVCGDRFHFVANAQWPLYADDGTVTRPDDLRGAVVLELPLAELDTAAREIPQLDGAE